MNRDERKGIGGWGCSAIVIALMGCAHPQRSSESSPSPSASSSAQVLDVDLEKWRTPRGAWLVVGDAQLDPSFPKNLLLSEGNGILVNGLSGQTSPLLSVVEHADVEIHLEFMVPKDSRSGVCFQGRYEVQIADSWQTYQPSFADCGGIDQSDENEKDGFEGASPRVNASLPSGSWQRFDITFRAPRFDDKGIKIENARFIKVLHNGVLIHENVELNRPTRAAFEGEVAQGPLMLLGDEGPVAFQNLWLRQLMLP